MKFASPDTLPNFEKNFAKLLPRATRGPATTDRKHTGHSVRCRDAVDRVSQASESQHGAAPMGGDFSMLRRTVLKPKKEREEERKKRKKRRKRERERREEREGEEGRGERREERS